MAHDGPVHSSDPSHGPQVVDELAAVAVTETITSAFAADPVWSWAFPAVPAWWRLFVDGALEHGSIWAVDDCAAVAIWLRPGEPELGPAQERQAHDLVAALPADQQLRLEQLDDLFARARPTWPHHYLTLFGTHQAHRGHGIGMRLLAHTLAHLDTTGVPAYLESTNPANLARYASVGFQPLGEFTLPAGPSVTTMWRRPGGQS